MIYVSPSPTLKKYVDLTMPTAKQNNRNTKEYSKNAKNKTKSNLLFPSVSGCLPTTKLFHFLIKAK